MTETTALGFCDLALQLYAAPDVAPACLHLQQECEADVPALLFAVWLGGRGHALTASAFAAMVTPLADWRSEVILPLRAVRQRMKTGPAPAPSDSTEALRDTVKLAELQAERIQMLALETSGLKALVRSVPVPHHAAIADNLRLALFHYHPVSLGLHEAQAMTLIADTAVGLN